MGPRRYSLFGMSALLIASCSGGGSSATTRSDAVSATGGGAAILALGDSIFEYNSGEGQSIPEVIGRELGIPVVNAARSGALFSNFDASAAEGLDIREQYQDGDWDWIVIIGGGNDYMDECLCGGCESTMDELVSVDGLSGEISDFVRDLVADGSRVMFVGYYDVRSDAGFGFDLCADEAVAHNGRLAVMAEAIDGVWFVSAGDVVSVDNRSAYAGDRVHPSVIGSTLVGEYLAAAIASIGIN